jgi:hypothetical protein
MRADAYRLPKTVCRRVNPLFRESAKITAVSSSWSNPLGHGRLTALNGMSTVITKDPIMRRTIDRVVFDMPRKIGDEATKMADKIERGGRLMRTQPHDREDRRPRRGALAKGWAAQRPPSDRVRCEANKNASTA